MDDPVRPPAGAGRERASNGGQGVPLLLLLFVLCTGIPIAVSGSRPGFEQGLAPALVQVTGYRFALVAGVLLTSSSMVATIRLALGVAAAGRAR